MASIFFNEIPISNPDLNNPGRGVCQWHNANVVNVPVEGINSPRHDVYWRFVSTKIEGRTKGAYNWVYFDNLFVGAIAKKQTLDFGIMTVFPGNEQEAGGQQFADGGWGCYPEWLHLLMMAESVKPWKSGTTWVPNYNSAHYHAWVLELNQVINNRLLTKGWGKVIGAIDIRSFGSWGEWHHSGLVSDVNQYPAGTFPTAASLKKIVDGYTQGYPDFPLVAMIAAFDAQYLRAIWNWPEIADYILHKTKNNWGLIGWRRDQWGATDSYLEAYLKNNNRSFAGGPIFSIAIMSRWQSAPITGEPPAWNPGDYFDLERQIREYHATSFGNGNYGVDPNTTIKTRVRAASKLCGYRFKVISATTSVGTSGLSLVLNWQSIGNGNAYQNWNIVFELVGTNFKAVSKHKLKFFQPSATPLAVTETFPLTGVPAGTYQLNFSVRDPNDYRANMALAITGGDSNFNYSLGSVTVGTITPPPNQGPTANAGGDIEITLPVNSVQLLGSGVDPDGNITAYRWAIVSGSGTLSSPSAQNTGLSNLVAGQTIVRLTVTDNQGATSSDDMIVKINPAPVPPPITKKIKSIKTVVDYNVVTYDDESTEIIDA